MCKREVFPDKRDNTHPCALCMCTFTIPSRLRVIGKQGVVITRNYMKLHYVCNYGPHTVSRRSAAHSVFSQRFARARAFTAAVFRTQNGVPQRFCHHFANKCGTQAAATCSAAQDLWRLGTSAPLLSSLILLQQAPRVVRRSRAGSVVVEREVGQVLLSRRCT